MGRLVCQIITIPRRNSGAPASQSLTVTTIRLNSDPQGADAATSPGWSCPTPCSIEFSVDGPFTVTFTRPGFAPRTIPVQSRDIFSALLLKDPSLESDFTLCRCRQIGLELANAAMLHSERRLVSHPHCVLRTIAGKNSTSHSLGGFLSRSRRIWGFGSIIHLGEQRCVIFLPSRLAPASSIRPKSNYE
jgi:hypothetical protein